MSISVMEIRMVFLLFFNSILSSLFCTMNINYFKIKPKNPIKITKQRLFLHARLYVFPTPTSCTYIIRSVLSGKSCVHL